ncbi:MAG: hypothetical protein U5K32_00490 [Bacteroidales bacterium]|nr:hypothetical protein [Bacteroidales bacterium]
MKLIRLVNENHRRFRIKQTERKLTITAKNIKNIEHAIDILSSIIITPGQIIKS